MRQYLSMQYLCMPMNVLNQVFSQRNHIQSVSQKRPPKLLGRKILKIIISKTAFLQFQTWSINNFHKE